VKPVRCNDILPRRGLIVGALEFRCPWCGRAWERGGHREGFVKSGANNHVYTCWEILLWQRGYAPGEWAMKGQKAVAIQRLGADRARYERSYRANLAKRRREGNVPTVVEEHAA
jgi:hypothetical protein